jgi:hypothetical protein
MSAAPDYGRALTTRRRLDGLVERQRRRELGASDDVRRLLRLREIEKLIRHRHGMVIPETDDPSYIEAAAFAINALLSTRDEIDKLDEHISGWCNRFAPWALSRAAELVRPILLRLRGRIYDLTGDEVARLLNVTYDEWLEFRFKTIRQAQLPKEQFNSLRRNNKKKRDRERQALKRREQGATSHSQSLSRTKPWEAEGISRRTWERRRGRDAETSHTSALPIGDEIATLPMARRLEVWAQTPRASSLPPKPSNGSDSIHVSAGRAPLVTSATVVARYGITEEPHV